MMFKYAMLAIAVLYVLSGSAMGTTVTLYPTDDSYIMEVQPGDNFGSHTSGFYGSSGSGALYGTFLFDLSAYSGVTVNDASLQIYILNYAGSFPPNGSWIARFIGSWDEGSITWNNQPGWDDWYYTTDPSLADWWEIDVTAWTVEWVNSTHGNYGVFIGADALGSDDWTRFGTKEESGLTYDPRLVLVYDEVSLESTTFGAIKATFR